MLFPLLLFPSSNLRYYLQLKCKLLTYCIEQPTITGKCDGLTSNQVFLMPVTMVVVLFSSVLLKYFKYRVLLPWNSQDFNINTVYCLEPSRGLFWSELYCVIDSPSQKLSAWTCVAIVWENLFLVTQERKTH